METNEVQKNTTYTMNKRTVAELQTTQTTVVVLDGCIGGKALDIGDTCAC